MSDKRTIEVFSAGCPVCARAVELVRQLTCPSCELLVLDMHDPVVAERAERMQIRSVPAVIIDGELAACCADREIDEAALRAAGLGQSK